MAEYFAHPTTVVDQGAQIGEGTRIWHFCHIMAGASIGRNCVLGQNVFVGNTAVIGNGVKVQNNVSVFDAVTIEDDVFLGPSMVFTNVINPRAGIDRKSEFLPTIIRKGATIGANATIICGIEIGEYAFIGAGAVVTRDVQAFALVTGNPGRMTGWMSRIGHQLRFDESGMATCPGDGSEYSLENGIVTPV